MQQASRRNEFYGQTFYDPRRDSTSRIRFGGTSSIRSPADRISRLFPVAYHVVPGEFRRSGAVLIVLRRCREYFLPILISTRLSEMHGKEPLARGAPRFVEYRRHAPAIGKRKTARKGEGEQGEKEGERGEGCSQVSSTCVAVILAHSPGPFLHFQSFCIELSPSL